MTPQNKFKILSSRVMQCGIKEKVVRSERMIAVRCFKCKKEGHKCRECLLWKKEYRVACLYKGKAHQEKKPVRLTRGKAQEDGEREARRVEKKVACPIKGEAQQEEWWRSSMEELRKRVEEHCGKGVPKEAQFLELG